MAERYYLLVYQEDGEPRSFFVVSPKGEPVVERESSVRILLENIVSSGMKKDLVTSIVPDEVLKRVKERYDHPEYVKRIKDKK